jgi:hypothetical protein
MGVEGVLRMKITARGAVLLLILHVIVITSSLPSMKTVAPNQKSAEDSNATLTIANESDVPGEGSNPTMEYYPRKYYAAEKYNYNLEVKVLAKDPDGIDSVIMHYADRGSSVWDQTTMVQTEDREDLFAANLGFSYNSTGGRVYDTFRQVFYVATDTLGNVAQSPLLEFGMGGTVLTVDDDPQLYDTPDLWYLLGTTGHEVTWATASHGFRYVLLKDGLLLEQHNWIWNQGLTINVDGLELGEHVYKLTVDGGWSIEMDTVTVHVVSELPTGVPTDSVGPSTDFVGPAPATDWGSPSITEPSSPTGLGTPLPIEVLAIAIIWALAAVLIVLIVRQPRQY